MAALLSATMRCRSPSLPPEIVDLLEPGLHADGGGLYLRVTETMSKSWVFIFHRERRRREMGLGSARVVSLCEARQKAGKARRLIARGHDPIALRRARQLGAA